MLSVNHLKMIFEKDDKKALYGKTFDVFALLLICYEFYRSFEVSK